MPASLRPAAHAILAFGPHVGAFLGGQFQCGVIGEDPHGFGRLGAHDMLIVAETPYPDANHERCGANCDEVFGHCCLHEGCNADKMPRLRSHHLEVPMAGLLRAYSLSPHSAHAGADIELRSLT